MKLNSQNLAAIDVGTNSFHLIVVGIKEDGNFEIIDREKEMIRLGEGSSGDIKYIQPDANKRAIETLKRFKGIADSHNAVVRAVATSAVRESHNKNEFIAKVFDETKIEIEVISGYEEARLIYLGILKAVPIYNKKALVFDIGGGSTEFVLGYHGRSLHTVSVKIGAVRLAQKFFPDYEITNQRVKDCRKWVEGEIFHASEVMKKEGFDICAGSSGTIMSAGLMIQAMRKGSTSTQTILNNFEFTKDELKRIEKEILTRKSVEKRKKIPGLDEKRADIIPAGIIILSTIFDLFELDKMTISGYALREGIIIDTLQKEHINGSTKPNLIDIRKESVKHLAESSRYDVEHCRHIAKFALKIFDDLKKLHQLGDECREYLEAAAILHDIGYHISHTNHHYHSYYIIRNSELLGFNDNEISIIANTARYHRKSHPKKSHDDFNELPVRAQQIIKKLSAILRVADSFDRTHKRIIENLELRIENQIVRIKLKVKKNGNPEIELWSLERRKALFEEVFEKKIIINY
ncbi:MAG: Ppx/GppA phosphatase family protein [Melioribacteraceae bacterium]|nr:Ppx/GppA phosphatase family protein [Melioribacteraceae bacterium]